MNRFLSTLSLCMRARPLAFGYETVKAAVKAGKVSLLLTASDLSEKSAKEAEFLSRSSGVPHLRLALSMEDITHAIGKKTGIIGITDPGLAAALTRTYHETEDHLCR